MIDRRGTARKYFQARRQWLIADPAAMQGVPGIHDDVTEHGRARLTTLVGLLEDEGLIGGSQADVQRETVRRLVSELRGERIGSEGW